MSLAAVLRALADGFANAADAAAAEATMDAAPAAPAKGRKARAAVTAEAAPPAPTPQPASPVPAPAPAAPAPAPQPAPPAAPAVAPITKDKLNKAVLAVAGVNREAAVEILSRFGVANTATLPVEKYQEVFDAFEEKKAQLDAASVQGSLV